jgi:hypothetical protein
MRFVIKIMIHPESDTSSDTYAPEELMEPLVAQVDALNPMISFVEAKLAAIAAKMKANEYDWFNAPLKPSSAEVAAACIKLGLVAPFTLKVWFKAIIGAAQVDLAPRAVRLPEEYAAPWHPESVFDLFRGIPTWFDL